MRTSWPPDYDAPVADAPRHAGHAGDCGCDESRRHHFPPPGMPSKAQIDYTTALIMLGLLLLMLPWLIGKVVTNPQAIVARSRWL